MADPGLAPAAVEEALRYEPITPFTARILVEDVEYRDVTFPEGTVVMVCAFTGNRDLDGASEEDGERFDITADRGRARAAHVRRGRALLPRREPRARGAAGGPRVPRAEHRAGCELDGEPAYEGVSGIYGLSALPLRFTV